MGYHLAGFEVTGVDLQPQPNYPFKFIRENALKVNLRGYDCYHVSPPCQAHSTMSKGVGVADNHRCLIEVIRKRLQATGKPYVIENVPSSPLINPVQLCGTSFKGLRVIRHRLFETNFWVRKLYCRNHPRVWQNRSEQDKQGPEDFLMVVGHCGNVERNREAMQIPWAKKLREVTEAIPPPYTRYLGKFLMDALQGQRDYSKWTPEWINA